MKYLESYISAISFSKHIYTVKAKQTLEVHYNFVTIKHL